MDSEIYEVKIVIDGPSGSGKSSTALEIARRLGYQYINTGAFYRALAVALKESGADIEKIEKSEETPRVVSEAVEKLEYESHPEIGNGYDFYFGGKKITKLLGDEEVGKIASKIAASPGVRKAVLEKIRRVAGLHEDLVADGRDCGTTIFPDADVKIFLTASAEARAKRIAADGRWDGSIKGLIDRIKERDKRDMTRAISPLIPAQDALTIDNTNLTKLQTVDEILRIASAKRAGGF